MPINKTVSVVLPAHNEAPNIKSSVENSAAACSKLFADYEILVVDDGSTDGTGAAVEQMSRENGRIKLVSHSANRGYGAALRSGFAAVSMEWTFFTDSDGQFDPGEMEGMADLLDQADIVAGYRIKRRDNFYRRLMGGLYTFLMNVFFGVGVKDVNCAFKFIRTKALKSFTLTSEGALINAEMLALARRRGLKIVQRGVHHYPRPAGKQSGGSVKVIGRAVREFAKLFASLRRGSEGDKKAGG